MEILGLDIGGSGIKGAPVNTETGELLAERMRFKTPDGAMPVHMVETAMEVIRHFNWQGPVGCGFPAAIRHGTVLTAANIDKSWIGQNAAELLSNASNLPCYVANDADVAGLAELKFGAGKGRHGVIFVVTLGTGIGTALFVNGRLVPNTELGHLYLENGKEGEQFAAESVRDKLDLPWKDYGKRVNEYLEELARLFWPDLFIIGGGGSKKFEKFNEELKVKVPVVPAELRNQAGIIGAALFARHEFEIGSEAPE